MFIQYLNHDQQEALYHFSKQIVAADGHTDENETLLLKSIVAQCSDNIDLDRTLDLLELPALFSEYSQKIAFLIELVGVGYADQTLAESENDVINRIAETIGVSLPRLEELKDWVQRQLALMTEAQKFLEE